MQTTDEGYFGMRYESSEAVRLDGYDMRSNMREASASPSFDVYEGGGLDARVRQGVTHQFLVKLVRVALVAAAICALGFARVAISTATVSALQANESLESQVGDATALYNDLKASKSALSSVSRIERIATQNYGMVLEDPEVISSTASSSDSAAASSTDGTASLSQTDAETADSSNVE